MLPWAFLAPPSDQAFVLSSARILWFLAFFPKVDTVSINQRLRICDVLSRLRWGHLRGYVVITELSIFE